MKEFGGSQAENRKKREVRRMRDRLRTKIDRNEDV